MTETPARDAPAPAGSERPITFREREIWVRLPSPEQYLVWKRSLKMLENADSGSWNAHEALRALERGRKIIDSMILNKGDIEWIDEQWLDGEFGLAETAQIIKLTTDAFGQKKDSAESDVPAKAAPVKRAARRKVAK